MKNGNLSSTPAPYVYVDGESLFSVSMFGCSPIPVYNAKLVKLMKSANVVIFIDKDGKVELKDITKAGFCFTDTVTMTTSKFLKYLRQNKSIVFASEARMTRFSGRCGLLEASAENILTEVGA